MKGKALRIFVMADTHDRLPRNMSILTQGADEIWHLGDICAPTILETIEQIGPPVTVVRGNCDSNNEWPIIVDLVRGGLRFRLQHIPPERPPENVDVLLHGHTHVPRNEKRGNVLFLNPGCVTRPNQGSPASVAIMEIQADGKLNWKLQTLR
jgi:putative phosphoesterase